MTGVQLQVENFKIDQVAQEPQVLQIFADRLGRPGTIGPPIS